MRFINISLFSKIIYEFFFSYPAPSNLSYFWNFGIYSLICLLIQIITGIFLAMHYCPEQFLAFFSIEHIMRDVQLGWLMRYCHANGASMFFIVVYIHTFRGLYFNSYLYPRQVLWIIGVVILTLMILTAFLGYVLPWGQMSFWAATVITNLVSAIPNLGLSIVIWLWGGYSIDNATLNRFFSLHYLFPFIILILVFIHLVILHEYGSNNPLGIEFKYIDHITMYPYYIYKDLLGLFIFFFFFCIFLFFMPNLLGHSDNYILANPMITPTHIVPEWYFLPFYAILRSIPDKLFGVITMLLSIILLIILPFINKTEIKSLNYRFFSRNNFWFFLSICILLGWIGSKSAIYPYVQIGQLLTFLYFINWLFIMPFLNNIELFFWTNFFYFKKFELKSSYFNL
jgi:ubiquinol-cytochrome c reductase cytochrome b subunit